MMKSLLLGFIAAISLAGCTTLVSDYEKRIPQFSMNSFFDGKLCAWGVVRERNGAALRKFVADVDATATNNKVVLNEKFRFDDGENQTRIWEFVKSGDVWKGTAGDVIGEALGEIAGDTLHLTYALNIQQKDGSEIIISMDDWLHLVDNDTLMGSTDMSKWGINVGRIDIVMQRQSNSAIQCIKG